MDSIDFKRRQNTGPHNTGKAIPSTVCSYYVNAQKGVGQGCLRLNCKFFHGTQEQLDELRLNSGMDPIDISLGGAKSLSPNGPASLDDAEKKRDRSKKPIVCLSFLADNCHRSDCRFVHLPPHIRPLPTSACTYNERGMCTRVRCRFFHGPEEALDRMTKDGVTMYNPLTNEPHDKRIDIASLDIARRGLDQQLGTTQHMYQMDVSRGGNFNPHHHQQMYNPPPPIHHNTHHGGFFAHAPFHQGGQVQLPPPPGGLVNIHQRQHSFQSMQEYMPPTHISMPPTFVFATPQSPSPSLGREHTTSSIHSQHRNDSTHLMLPVGHSDHQTGSGHQLRSISTADAEHGGSMNDPFAFRSGSGAVYMPLQQQTVVGAHTQFLQASAHASSNSDYPVQGSGSHSHHEGGSGFLVQTREGLFVSGMPSGGYAAMRFER